MNRQGMEIHRIAAFALDGAGGNPAGVALCESMPPEREMLHTAETIGYSETAFLVPLADDPGAGFRIRYFAPQMEVPFCGHATIASGAFIGQRFGAGRYPLVLNDSAITVEASGTEAEAWSATLESPQTWSEAADPKLVARVLPLFDLEPAALDDGLPPAIAFAGARHLVLALARRRDLDNMAYEFEALRRIMLEQDLVTVDLVWRESESLWHCRNPFAFGGVYEDPATGAAAAAFCGYLRDLGRAPEMIDIRQGAQMGSPSLIQAAVPAQPGEGILITGQTRRIPD